MRHLQLPDGSFVHPAQVKQFEIAKHLWRDKYYVRAKLRDGGAMLLSEELSFEEAKELRARYDQEVQELNAEIPAYDDGVADGRHSGYEEGRVAGYKEGIASGQHIANGESEQIGIQRVLGYVSFCREELIRELSYSPRLSEGRRRSINDMIGMLTRITDEFTPTPPAEST